MPIIGDYARLPIRSIDKQKYSGLVYNLHVENDESYVTQFIVHNSYGMNLPARRVLVFGVHRGMNTVDPADIIQEFGRAGRPGYDKEGDAYVLLPETKYTVFKAMLEKEPFIKSQMLNPEVLAFYLISGIERQDIKTEDDVIKWYSRSLSKFQGGKLNPNLVQEVVRMLEQINAIKLVNGVYECQAIGKVASWFYQSPFDVSDWKENFKKIFARTTTPDDFDIAWGISHIGSKIKSNWKHKEDDYLALRFQVECNKRGYSFSDNMTTVIEAIKFYLSGKGLPKNGRSALYNFVYDAERVVDTVKTAGMLTKAYNPDAKFWSVMTLRLQTGANREMVPLVEMEHVGIKRAGILLKNGIRTPAEVMVNAKKVKELLGEAIGDKVVAAANIQVRKAPVAPTAASSPVSMSASVPAVQTPPVAPAAQGQWF